MREASAGPEYSAYGFALATSPESQTLPSPAAARAAVVATTIRYFVCLSPRSAPSRRQLSFGLASSMPSGVAAAFVSSFVVSAASADPGAANPAATASAAIHRAMLSPFGCR